MALDDQTALSLGRLDDLLGFHLRMASAAVARDFADAMADLNLTQKQCAVLELIEANRGVAQIDIAAALGMDRATMMAVVDRLDERGLVTRSPSQRDRRRQELALSAAGQQILREARRRIARHEKRFVDRLGADRAEKLAALLREIYA